MLVSYKTIGRNIRDARNKKRLTQEQIAEKLKISQLHFGRLERGERPVSLEMLAEIANALDVTITSLLSGCVNGEDFMPVPQDGARAVGESVTSLANGCSPRARQLMLSLCQVVAECDKHPDVI